MVDQSHFSESAQQSPAANAIAVTPDNTDFTQDQFTRGVYVGTTGDLGVRMAGNLGDVDVVFIAVPAGMLLPIRVKQIRTTGTTASNIIALF